MNNIINLALLFLLIILLLSNKAVGSVDSIKSKSSDNYINDTIILFEENFNDGDLINNPTWILETQQVCAPEPSQISVADEVLKVYQSGAGICGTLASIKINLNIPLSDSTKVQFDVKPTFSNVDEGAGWFDNEFPIFVSLHLGNTNNISTTLRFGYNYRGGNSKFKKNLISLAFTDCRQDTWLRDEVFTIRDFFPDAVKIERIEIGGCGWDYEGYLDNFIIFDCCSKNQTQINTGNEGNTEYDIATEKYKSFSKSDKAIDLYKEYLRSSEKNNDHNLVCEHLYKIGDLYFESGVYDSALVYFLKLYYKSVEIDNSENLKKSLNGLIEIYQRWNEFDQALVYLNNLLKYNQDQDDKTGIILTQNEIAGIYSSQGNLQKAVEFYNKSLSICKENESIDLMAKTLESLGDNFHEDGQNDKTLEYYRNSLKANEKSGNINSVALILYKIANVYRSLQNYNLVIDNLNKSLRIAENQNLKSLESNIYLSFSEVYNILGNNKTALGYYKLYTETKEFIKDKESNREITELYVKYETEKKEKEIEILTKNNEISKLKNAQNKKLALFFIIISSLVFMLAFLIYNRYRINKKTNRILSNQKDKLSKALEEREIVQAELKALNQNLEKKVKEEVQKFTEQKKIVVEQSRLADIGLLAAGIAHELNNPLQSMYLSLQNMHESLMDKNADEEYLDQKIKYISEDINRMKNIISHVRLFSRDYSTDIRENFNINESIENALSMFKVQYANHKISLSIKLSENRNYIFGNKYKYERVVLNLLFNAKDALEEKEKQMKERFQKIISIRSFQENDFSVMEFNDNGIGITQKNLDKIFEAFYTTKEPGKGTGLGLSISKEIISDMGGEFLIESKEMEGTTMIVKVPVTNDRMNK